MSSTFEGPPQDSRIISAPSVPPRPWTRMLAAFAAGVACTFLYVTISSIVKPPVPPETKLSQRTQSSPPANPSGSPAVAGKAASSADTSRVADTDKATEPAKSPPPEQSAAAATSATTPAPQPVRRPTEGQRSTTAPPIALTTNGGEPVQRIPPRSSELAGAPAEQAQVATTGAAPAEDTAASTSQVNAPVGTSQVNTPPQAPPPHVTSRPADRAPKEATRATSRSEPRRNARSANDRPAPVRNVFRDDDASDDDDRETKPARNERETKPARRKSAHGSEDDSRRGPRTESLPETDDDGYTLVRSHRLPDGRRVGIYERPAGEGRQAAQQEETLRPRTPFFFNPGQPGD
jgi:hypothetical protein